MGIFALRNNGNKIMTDHGPVVAVDLIAKLAGVSVKQVIKTLAAIDVVVSISQDAPTVLNTENLPMGLPDDERRACTESAYAQLLESQCPRTNAALSLVGWINRKIKKSTDR